MTEHNRDPMGTAFTVSVDAKKTTTGISAHERALTIQRLIDPNTKPSDLRRRGTCSLQAVEGGVLMRAGHTKRRSIWPGWRAHSGRRHLRDHAGRRYHGTYARAHRFAQKHNMKIITVESLIRYRRRHEMLVERVVVTEMPTKYGISSLRLPAQTDQGRGHRSRQGRRRGKEGVLVRMHSGCVTGDILGSLRCDCGDQLAAALTRIENEGLGVLVCSPTTRAGESASSTN